jgi:hypothetical protein
VSHPVVFRPLQARFLSIRQAPNGDLRCDNGLLALVAPETPRHELRPQFPALLESREALLRRAMASACPTHRLTGTTVAHGFARGRLKG